MATGRRILLLADDSPATRKVVSLTFADEGLEVVAVSDGDEAARRLEEGLAPDIVLADVLMPGLTGYELCERIKGEGQLRHVPVVLLVGTFEPFDEAEARRVGADTVLTKPFQSIRDLVSKVGSLLGGSKREAEDEAARPEAPPPVDAAAPYADIRMDDEMIEARPAESHEARDIRPPAPFAAREDSVSDSFADTLRGPFAADLRVEDERQAAQVFAEEESVAAPAPVAEESRAAQPAFAARGAGAADEALLDLDLEPPASASEADDLILDLPDEEAAPAPHEAAPLEATPIYMDESVSVEADAAGAFAEAAHGETVQASSGEVASEVVAQEEPQEFGDYAAGEVASAPRGFVEPEVVPAGEPSPVSVESGFTDGSVEGDVAKPPVSAVAEPVVESEAPFPPPPSTESYEMGAARAGVEERLRPEQLSPEAIDAIARRVVEMMSDEVVREIAWEVVPELAELLIRRKLEEDARRQ